MASSWACDGFGLGQRPLIGLVLAGAMAVERELVEQMRGRRSGVRFGVGIGVAEGEGVSSCDMAGCLAAGGSAAPIAAFTAIPWPGAETGLHPQPGSPRRLQSWGGEGRSAAEDGAGQPFCFAMQSRAGAGSDGD